MLLIWEYYFEICVFRWKNLLQEFLAYAFESICTMVVAYKSLPKSEEVRLGLFLNLGTCPWMNSCRDRGSLPVRGSLKNKHL